MQFVDEVEQSYWEGKRVLVRVGFDMGERLGAAEEYRIRVAIPTITFLLQQGARLVLLNHNGRPGGKMLPELSNAPIAKRLALMLGDSVPLLPLDANRFDTPLSLLENLRFHPGEEANDITFARILASKGDIYVNEAFSDSHRAHASMVALPGLLPHFGGLQLKRELSVLTEVLAHPLNPLLLIVGGVKMGTKVAMIKNFWDKAQGILLGGVIANTLLHLNGIAVGKSIVAPKEGKELRELPLTDTRLHLPVDVRVAREPEGVGDVRMAGVGKLADDEIILDVGPDSELLFDNLIKSAKMIIWNGPLGKCEIPEFCQGTKALLGSLLKSEAKIIIGGGETIEFVEQQHALDKFFFVSTGGGAMLAFLAGQPMPGIEALS